MRNSTASEITVLVIGIACIALGLVIGPVLSVGEVLTWLPVGIGVLLLAQWTMMRRARMRRDGAR
jgi:hypothetical protein